MAGILYGRGKREKGENGKKVKREKGERGNE